MDGCRSLGHLRSREGSQDKRNVLCAHSPDDHPARRHRLHGSQARVFSGSRSSAARLRSYRLSFMINQTTNFIIKTNNNKIFDHK